MVVVTFAESDTWVYVAVVLIVRQALHEVMQMAARAGMIKIFFIV